MVNMRQLYFYSFLWEMSDLIAFLKLFVGGRSEEKAFDDNNRTTAVGVPKTAH